MAHYLYIIKCEDNYLYVGITHSIPQRFLDHKKGLCRNTKNRGRLKLCYWEEFADIHQAACREKEIKGWRREKKDNLINQGK
jgi:putative endonuclease